MSSHEVRFTVEHYDLIMTRVQCVSNLFHSNCVTNFIDYRTSHAKHEKRSHQIDKVLLVKRNSLVRLALYLRSRILWSMTFRNSRIKGASYVLFIALYVMLGDKICVPSVVFSTVWETSAVVVLIQVASSTTVTTPTCCYQLNLYKIVA